MPPIKEVSETIRNLATAAGIVVGGLWVLYEWETFFPKTEAEVAAAAATVRANVIGSFEVITSAPPSDANALDVCASGGTDVVVLELPIVAHARVSNTGRVPIWIETSSLQIRRHDTGIARFMAGPHETAFGNANSDGMWGELDYRASVGERAALVAPGQSDDLFVAVLAHFPFNCVLAQDNPDVAPLFAVQLGVTAEATDPRTGERIAESNIGLGFTKPCRISVAGEADCSIIPNTDVR